MQQLITTHFINWYTFRGVIFSIDNIARKSRSPRVKYLFQISLMLSSHRSYIEEFLFRESFYCVYSTGGMTVSKKNSEEFGETPFTGFYFGTVRCVFDSDFGNLFNRSETLVFITFARVARRKIAIYFPGFAKFKRSI